MRREGRVESRTLRSGEARRQILDPKVEHVTLLGAEAPGRQVLAFTFEKKVYRRPLEYLLFLWPELPAQLEDRESTRILSLSVDRELFSRRFGSRIESELIPALANVFVALSCQYAYAMETDLPVSSSFGFPPGQDAGSGLPIREIDTSRHIHGVYPTSLLSQNHWERVSGRFTGLADADDTQPLSDFVPEGTGRLLRLKDSSERTYARVAEALQPLIPPREVTRKTSSLLIRPDELAAMGGEATLRAELKDAWVRVLPHGFAQVDEPQIETVADSTRQIAALQRIYGDVYPEVRSGRLYIHERMESFPGLLDPQRTLYRIPGAPSVSRSLLVFRGESGARSAPLDIHLLLARRTPERGQRRVHALLEEWVSTVSKHEGSYGRLTILKEPSIVEASGALDLQLTADVSELQQEAIDLLVLMLDEQNRSQWLVPYLMLGDIQRDRWAVE